MRQIMIKSWHVSLAIIMVFLSNISTSTVLFYSMNMSLDKFENRISYLQSRMSQKEDSDSFYFEGMLKSTKALDELLDQIIIYKKSKHHGVPRIQQKP